MYNNKIYKLNNIQKKEINKLKETNFKLETKLNILSKVSNAYNSESLNH